MTRQITEAYLYGWRPDNPYAGVNNVRYTDYAYKGEDVELVQLSERAQDLKDSAQVRIHNPDGIYTDGEHEKLLEHGDRVEYQTRINEPLIRFGDGPFGVGVFQPTLNVRWTGIVRNYSVEADGRNIFTLEFDAEDFAYAIMGMRQVTNSWQDEQIVTGGDGQGIIDTILRNECPELDRSELPTLPDETSIRLADRNVLEAIVELVNRANLVIWAEGTTVKLSQPEELQSEFTVEPGDYTVWTYKSNDDLLFNRVRVEGGESQAEDPNASQPIHDAWKWVNNENRIMVQTDARKNAIKRVDIWTDPTRTNSGDDLIVRLQKDDGGTPVDPEDTKSDIARKALTTEFLAEGDWTAFQFPDHNLADPDPWLIIETSDRDGHDVGVRDADDELAYVNYYPYPIRTRRDDRQSIRKYRLREETLTDNAVGDLSAARDKGRGYLDHHKEPDVEFDFAAKSERLHQMGIGDVVRVEMEAVDAAARFVCIQRDTEWQGSHEEATITLRDLSTL